MQSTAGKTISTLPSSPAVWIAAARPQFLTVTAVAVLVGWASAAADHIPISWRAAAATLLAALLMHAGANLINDFHDRDADAVNAEGIAPFTGGSRMIRDGVFPAIAIGVYGYLSILVAIGIGLALALADRAQLVALGGIGLALATMYSAPPLRFSARGIGELAIAAAWLLVVVGADMVQRCAWSFTPLAAGVPIGLLIAAILHVNEFPDYSGDKLAGKNTIVVKLGPLAARWSYLLVVAAAYLWLATMIFLDLLPRLALLGMLSLPLSLHAAREVFRHAGKQPTTLMISAIKSTILAAHVHGVGLAAGLFLT